MPQKRPKNMSHQYTHPFSESVLFFQSKEKEQSLEYTPQEFPKKKSQQAAGSEISFTKHI